MMERAIAGQSTSERQNIRRVTDTVQGVPQNPNNEAASALERIRAEPAARDAEEKPRGQHKIHQDQS